MFMKINMLRVVGIVMIAGAAVEKTGSDMQK